MRIGNREITRDSPAYLVAEIGLNHGGSLDRALAMLEAAAAAGADAVKFQAVKADTLVHPNSPTYFHQEGTQAQTQHEFFKRSDHLNPADYRILADAAKVAGVDFLCTVFTVADVEWLNELVPAWKIASADITNGPLLRAVGATQKPTLLSTGAATRDEIRAAYLDTGIGAGSSMQETALLHCVLSYPTPQDQAQLATIMWLQEHYPYATIGYSDHTLATPGMEVCTAAYLVGARIIEKHFTDDKTAPGNDHYHSMNAEDLSVLRERCDTLRCILGKYGKDVLPVEAIARQHARRGLYAARAIQRGTQLTAADVAILRPPARLGPESYDDLLGSQAERDYAAGDPL